MKKNVFKWLIVVLTIHIFSVMAGLLHGLNGQNENLFAAIVFAASYSVASAFVVYIANRNWLIIGYAVADGLAVLFYYFSGTPEWLISVFFGFYTFGLIASTIYLTRNGKQRNPANSRSRTKPTRRTGNKKTGNIRQVKRARTPRRKNNTAISSNVQND